MADGAKFEVGKIYGHSFIGDSDARVYWRVSSRSGSMMTIESVGWGQKESRRVKIRERPGEGEWAYSMGQYSMAPIIRANKEGKFSRSGEKDMMAAGDMTTPEAIAKMMEAWNKIEAQAKKQFPNASKEELYRITKSAMESALKFKFSRPGAKATFKVEDRFYFGKGRKERFWARGYDDAKDRVRRSPELGKYAKIIMQPEFDTADHWEWVSRASTSEIVNWAKSISRDM